MSRFGLLFPGQGSQSGGMGRSLHDSFPDSRKVFEAADEALGSPISEVCFEGTDADLALTENTQPAILTVSIAALSALRALGLPEAAAAAGHSLGEYSAHVAAGTLDFADAVRTVRARGRFMQDAVPVGVGAMTAILGLEVDAVVSICEEAAGDEIVQPANLNSPGQVVVAGHAGAVARAGDLARERGARMVAPLPVSAPFHCTLMQPAADALESVLVETTFRTPRFPVYANVDASRIDDGDDARRYLIRQVVSPVRWVDVVEAMLADGIRTFLEVGPGKVLAGLVRRIDRGARVLPVSDAETAQRAIEALQEDG